MGQVCVDYVGRVPTYPPEDSKMELEDLFSSCGGPAATALVTLTRSGVACSFLGSISDDPFGVQIVHRLKKEGVNTSFLKITPGLNSQFAFIAVSGREGRRTIFWTRSRAPELLPIDFSLRPFSKARVLHLDGLMLDAGKKAAQQARLQGMTVVMDAGTLRDGTLELIPGVDILIASESFADAFAGADVSRQKVLECLRELGPKQVVITLGAKGSIGLDQGRVASPGGISRGLKGHHRGRRCLSWRVHLWIFAGLEHGSVYGVCLCRGSAQVQKWRRMGWHSRSSGHSKPDEGFSSKISTDAVARQSEHGVSTGQAGDSPGSCCGRLAERMRYPLLSGIPEFPPIMSTSHPYYFPPL